MILSTLIRKGGLRSLGDPATAISATGATGARVSARSVAPVAEIARPEFNRYEWEERAAILEYDAGLRRCEAERMAAEDQGLNIEEARRRWLH